MSDRSIPAELIQGFAGRFEQNPARQMAMNTVTKNGLQNSAERYQGVVDMQQSFSIQLEPGKITNQKNSGRCWLFAGLNTMRLEIMKRCNLETFELSQSFAMFYDKLEKANFFYESILDNLDEPIGSRILDHLLLQPMQDGGQWDMFVAIVEKYGVVPKAMMPETFHSSNTGALVARLTLRLREDAMILRDAAKAGESRERLEERKLAMLEVVYGMLCVCLGTPPGAFDFEYRDKDKQFHAERNLTPQAFYQKYVGQALDDYVSIINAPTKDKPYGRTFTVSLLGNVKGGREVKYLNLPSEQLKRLSIAQLQDGEPVWFGCDVGQMLNRGIGAMNMGSFDYEALLGTRFGMDKAQRLDYRESMLTHAMVFLGVNLVDGKPNRWRVENSWGEKAGVDGYYIMSDDWFDEYNYQVVIHKKHLSADQLQAYEQPPIVLEPWDPMGSLA